MMLPLKDQLTAVHLLLEVGIASCCLIMASQEQKHHLSGTILCIISAFLKTYDTALVICQDGAARRLTEARPGDKDYR